MPANPLEMGVIAVFAISGMVLFGLAVVVARYREARGTWEFAALLALTGVWATSAAVKLPAPQHIERVLLSMEIVYGVLFGIAFLVFAAEYTGHSFHRRRAFGVVIGAYLLAILVALATNPEHGMLWAALGFTTEGFPHLIFVQWGPLYWGLIGVSYALYGTGVYYLLDLHLRSRFNTEALVLVIVGVSMLVLVNLVSIVDEGPVPGLDYTPFGLAVFGLATTAAINRDLFDIVPIARDTAVEHSSEGMIILDADRRIRDSNPTARELFPALATSTGRPVSDALPIEALTFDCDRPHRAETTVTVDGTERTISLTTAPISDGAHDLGWSLVASDITELKRREHHLELVARVLRHNMSNEITVIQGQTEVLRPKVDGDLQTHLDRIVESGKRIVTTSGKLRRIQDIVTDDRGPVPTNLGRYVETIVARIEDAHPEADIDADAPDVWVLSTTGLGAAIENLVENAILHADTERPWVGIEGAVDPDAVTITVADEGPGIPHDERRILDEGETPLRHSSGVGLWLVYRYVERARVAAAGSRSRSTGPTRPQRTSDRRSRVAALARSRRQRECRREAVGDDEVPLDGTPGVRGCDVAPSERDEYLARDGEGHDHEQAETRQDNSGLAPVDEPADEDRRDDDARARERGEAPRRERAPHRCDADPLVGGPVACIAQGVVGPVPGPGREDGGRGREREITVCDPAEEREHRDARDRPGGRHDGPVEFVEDADAREQERVSAYQHGEEGRPHQGRSGETGEQRAGSQCQRLPGGDEPARNRSLWCRQRVGLAVRVVVEDQPAEAGTEDARQGESSRRREHPTGGRQHERGADDDEVDGDVPDRPDAIEQHQRQADPGEVSGGRPRHPRRR
jgi:signal transduction histidine kinase